MHGVVGLLPKSPPDEVALPLDRGIADSLRTACKILSPLPKLCKGQCLGLQIRSEHVEVLHGHTILCAVVASEVSEPSSLTWMRSCRGFLHLHSAVLSLERACSKIVLASAGWPWLCFNVLCFLEVLQTANTVLW